ncbi:MAG: lytic transglycosylase domain-containing protein [Nitrospirota bacterium]|nr:lytic transglycosylase domain-containing protein [Nitrospirota bacterium]
MWDLELEQAVNRAAQQHHDQPALLLAVMKAESSFNPIAVSKAGAVGLMRLIPETAIRHGVRNLYDANDNISGGGQAPALSPESIPRKHPTSLGCL